MAGILQVLGQGLCARGRGVFREEYEYSAGASRQRPSVSKSKSTENGLEKAHQMILC